MSKKRTTPESSSTDEQKNERGSDSVFEQDDNAKRVKLISLSDTTVQDLPIELLEFILIKAVVMEVKGMKLAKSVWKEKAELVISRLRTVCSQWNSILRTNFFLKQLNRTLDDTAQETIRLEISHQSPFELGLWVASITTLKDEIFLLCIPPHQDHFINVYDRNNMAKVKDVIPLPGLRPRTIAACSVSNCVYILNRKIHYHISILRITRDDEHGSSLSPVISDMCLPEPMLCVTADGSLILSREESRQVSVLDANGSVQQEIKLSSDISDVWCIIPKSNGNVVLVSGHYSETNLTEIDLGGTVIRQYQSSFGVFAYNHADNYGRLLIVDQPNGMELLDSEFNHLEFTGPQLGGAQFMSRCKLHYNSERDEIIAIVCDQNYQNFVLTIFQLIEI